MDEPKSGRSSSLMEDRRSPAMVREGLESLFDIQIPDLGNRWGSFVANDKATKFGSDLAIARMVIRAESPFDIPSSIKVRSLGRIFIIKINLGDFSKPFLGSDRGGNEVRFVVEWPSDRDCNEFEQVDIDSHTYSLPQNVAVPVGWKHRLLMGWFGASGDVQGDANNMELTAGHVDLADGRKNCEVRLAAHKKEIGTAQEEVQIEEGRVVASNYRGLSFSPNHVGGW
ncbi:hypothetical protein V6N13_054394 [Hibiscus sabdariffa]